MERFVHGRHPSMSQAYYHTHKLEVQEQCREEWDKQRPHRIGFVKPAQQRSDNAQHLNLCLAFCRKLLKNPKKVPAGMTKEEWRARIQEIIDICHSELDPDVPPLPNSEINRYRFPYQSASDLC
jgi:hypothetical protein